MNSLYALKRHWVCFLCRKPMFDMGRFFRPPRRNDHAAWYELWTIAEHGTRFCRASLHAYHRMLFGRSDRLKARDVIANCNCRYPSNPGERLLVAIARRMRCGKVAK